MTTHARHPFVNGARRKSSRLEQVAIPSSGPHRTATATQQAPSRTRNPMPCASAIAGLRSGEPRHPQFASSDAGRGFRPSIAATAEVRALVSFTRGHAYEAGVGERRARAFGDCGSLGRNRKRRACRHKRVSRLLRRCPSNRGRPRVFAAAVGAIRQRRGSHREAPAPPAVEVVIPALYAYSP